MTIDKLFVLTGNGFQKATVVEVVRSGRSKGESSSAIKEVMYYINDTGFEGQGMAVHRASGRWEIGGDVAWMTENVAWS